MQIAVRITLAALSPEPLYTGGPFVSGVAKLGTANPPVGGWGWGTEYFVSCGAFGERVDIVTGGNYGQLLDTEMSLSNHDKWFAPFASAGASLVGAKVEIGEAISADDMILSWVGVVADATFQGMNIEMRVENILATRHKIIPARTLTAQEFGAISEDGLPVPILYNAVEALTPQNIKSTQYIPGAYRVSEVGGYDAEIQGIACLAATSSGFRAPHVIATGTARHLDARYFRPGRVEDNFQITSWYARAIWYLEPVYVEVISGTGSGQIRKLSGMAKPGNCSSSMSATHYAVAGITAPWDTIPDTTSVLRFYRTNTPEILLVGDEAIISRTYAIESGKEFTMPASQGAVAGVTTSDVSSEFRNGENYSALVYVAPEENYGIAKLNDRIATISSANWNTVTGVHVNTLTSLSAYIADAFCKTKVVLNEFPDGNEDARSIDLMFSFDLVDRTVNDVRAIAIGTLLDGNDEIILDGSTGIYASSRKKFNNYSPAMASGGEFGNFSAYTVKADLPRPLSAYESIRAALFISATGEYTQLNHGRYGLYTSGANKIRFAYRDDVHSYVRVGDKIRPYNSDSLEFNSARFYIPGSKLYVGDSRDWRTISGLSLIMSGGDPVAWEATLDSAFDIPTGSYDVSILYDFSATFYEQHEVEAGFAFVFGKITPDSEFRVNVSSGRTYSDAWPELPIGVSNGDPIIFARDAVLDMYYRDLGLGADSVDFASFQALRSDRITSALVERVNSADRVATLCQQFNWVVGHDKTGRETATAWLLRIGSTEYDLSIDTSDVVEGSLTGVSMTDILDLVNNPNVKWNWTQADGYRSSSNVSDVSADPLILNAGNYLQYLTGFGDFSSSLDVYTAFHASYKLNTYQKSAVFELPDVGEDASRVLWPGRGMNRFDWMASRKPLYSLVVPDTSAAASCVVGQRVRLRHKRYTAGLWVYGTIVEWSMDPMAAECSIIVMGDPVPLTSGTNLIVDTIDPTGSVPTWEDQVDGISDGKIDSIGVA